MAGTSYSTGMLDKTIDILNRKAATFGKFGLDSDGPEYEVTFKGYPADVTWSKGKRALNEGAIDAYGVVEVRMRFYEGINMRSRIVYLDQVYQILPETFHPDFQANTIQFLAQLVIND